MQSNAIAADIARYVAGAGVDELSGAAQRETVRNVVNFLGCAIGGSRDEIVDVTERALLAFAGPEQATVLGRGRRSDLLNAALLNCLSSSVYAYDDTFADTILHPGGPVAAPLLALAEWRPMKGPDFLLAMALGVEIECRLSMAVAAPPARAVLAWSQTGIAGGVGAAIAAGKALGLDVRQMTHAIGIAAGQGAGYRALHATMCTPMMPAHAAQTGLRAAFLAQSGFTALDASLEHPLGFLHVFAAEPNPAALTDGLGREFRLIRNTYKPYPCGIVMHGIVDACLAIRTEHDFDPATIASVAIAASRATLTLTGARRHPQSVLDGQLSLHHWAAVALLDRAAGMVQGSVARLTSPDVASLRDRIEAAADESLAHDQARVRVVLADGRVLETAVFECSGSVSRPLTDEQLATKFIDNAAALGPQRARALLEACLDMENCKDVGSLARLAA